MGTGWSGRLAAGIIVALGTGARAAPIDLDAPAPPAVEIRAPERGSTDGGPQGPDAARGNPLWSVSLASLSATRERPLFSSSRRPPAAAAPPPSAPPPPPSAPTRPRLTLIGTLVSAADGYGIFLDPATNAVLRLRTGEGHEGWVLRAVSLRDATLQSSAGTAVLALPLRPGGGVAAPVVRGPDGSLTAARTARPGGLKPTAERIVVPRRPPASPLESYPDH